MKRIPISKKLFSTYTTLFVVFYLCIIAVAVTLMAADINRNIIATQKQMAQAISRTVEQYFEEMNNFSLRLMNSLEFKQAVIYDLPRAQKDGASQLEPLERVYRSAYEMFNKGYYIGVATRDDMYLWMADRILVERVPKHVTTYDSYTKYGAPMLLSMSENAFLSAIDHAQATRYAPQATLCLARSINVQNRFSHPQAMLEIHVLQTEFDRFMHELAADTGVNGLQVSVYSAAGGILYGESAFPGAQAVSLEWQPRGGNMAQMHSLFGNGIYVLYEIPTGHYYAKLTQFVGWAVALTAVLCAAVLLVTYRISQQLSKPMREMSRQLECIDLSGTLPFEKVSTELYELDVLAQAVATLDEKLRATLGDIVLLRTAEMQSRLMALQSQMQPHFLHNTLALIGGLSEQGAHKEVSRICTNLSQMLRYVSSQEDSGVSLFDEVRFLRSYADIMKERFPLAQLHLDIPLDMMRLEMPKLIVQPLVENAFKYRGDAAPVIRVTGSADAWQWRIFVSDNGPGFSQETADGILARCASMAHSASGLTAHIDGMGLVNIYARLLLHYREAMIFRIVPGKDGGVEIGGAAHVLS